MANKRIGLALSGGGVKALAHVGFIKALLEHNITPNILSGTSGGALVAALYASGKSPEEMLDFFKRTPLFKFSLITWNKAGIVDSAKYQKILREAFGLETFEALSYPVTVTATNITDGTLAYFNKGDLIKPIIASSALPPYFSPVTIDGQLYSDGGVLNNFPTEPLMRRRCDVILGSFVNPVMPIEPKEVNNILKLIQRVYHISLEANHHKKIVKCHYVFMPKEVLKIGLLDTRMINKAYNLGYENALREMPKILKAINGS